MKFKERCKLKIIIVSATIYSFCFIVAHLLSRASHIIISAMNRIRYFQILQLNYPRMSEAYRLLQYRHKGPSFQIEEISKLLNGNKKPEIIILIISSFNAKFLIYIYFLFLVPIYFSFSKNIRKTNYR